MRGKEVPDGGVLVPEHPGAETLEAAIPDQRITFAECADDSIENPFTQVIAIKVEPRGAVHGPHSRWPLYALARSSASWVEMYSAVGFGLSPMPALSGVLTGAPANQ